MQCGKCGGRMSENAGGWWTCWGCGNSQPAYLRNITGHWPAQASPPSHRGIG